MLLMWCKYLCFSLIYACKLICIYGIYLSFDGTYMVIGREMGVVAHSFLKDICSGSDASHSLQYQGSGTYMQNVAGIFVQGKCQ